MKTIYLVRHAKSSWEDVDLRDHDRPLNKRGKSDAPMMADIFKEREGDVDAIVTSTAIRANSTAEFFAEALDLNGTDRVLHSSSLYCSMSRDVHDVIRSLPEAYESVALFGHNPSFTALANQFEGQSIANVPTCGVVKIVSEIDSWEEWSARKGRIEYFIFPKMFKGVNG
jgi:phosphohistidine phosphatase